MNSHTLKLVSVAITLFAAGCAKKPPEVAAAEDPPAVTAAAPKPIPEAVIEEMIMHFNKVHFSLDSSELTPVSIEALSANAQIMQKYPRLQIEVEGHADERGTTDYNLALGEKRAKAVAKAMQGMGVSLGRVHVISYGEERPEAKGSGESAWTQNRRCEFRILTVEPKVQGTVAEG